jgi:hypothetical protein
MTETAYALHCHEIARTERGIAQGVVGRNTRAEKRRRLYDIKRVREGHDGVAVRQHHFRISTVDADAADCEILTIDKIASPAKLTLPVVAPKKTHADSLAQVPSRNLGADRFDTSGYLVPRHSGQMQPWKLSFDRARVGMTNAARFDTDQNLTWARFRGWPFNHSELPGLRDFQCLVCR